jgi:hypothetical protein
MFSSCYELHLMCIQVIINFIKLLIQVVINYM